jgi:tetratricopeptide (TPR) repeat protein
LTDAGRAEEAIDAYTKAINKKPAPRAYLGRGMNLMKQQRFEEAERELSKAINFPGERIEPLALFQTYRTLGLTYLEQGKSDEAARLFSSGRSVLPMYAAALTVDLAIVLYKSGKKEAALRELERVRARARAELLPESKEVFFRLGSLYFEAGMKDEARAALVEYMDASRTFSNRYTPEYRAAAERVLQALN